MFVRLNYRYNLNNFILVHCAIFVVHKKLRHQQNQFYLLFPMFCRPVFTFYRLLKNIAEVFIPLLVKTLAISAWCKAILAY